MMRGAEVPRPNGISGGKSRTIADSSVASEPTAASAVAGTTASTPLLPAKWAAIHATADCPPGGFCYIFDQTDGHICARVCTSDAECSALKSNLLCKARTSTGALEICVP